MSSYKDLQTKILKEIIILADIVERVAENTEHW